MPVNELAKLIATAVADGFAAAAFTAREIAHSPEAYLTREETAKLLHVTLTTLNKHTNAGVFKAHRIGSRVLYLRSEVLDATARAQRAKQTGAKRGPKPKQARA